MRFAYVSDVHGNLPALQAVLAEVRGLGVDALVSGGDVVSGPSPLACLDALEAIDWTLVHFVRGNADRLAVTAAPDALPEDVAAGEAIGSRGRARLRGWADAVVLGGWTCVHATPLSDSAIVTKLTPPERLPLTAHARVLGGHVHHQFATAGRWFNAGSVGSPYEDRAGAYWALVDGGDIELRRTDYSGAPQPDATADEAAAEFERRASG